MCVCVCVCVCNGILFDQKIEGNSAICNNIDGPQGHYGKWGKSDKDKYYIISLICGVKNKQEKKPKATPPKKTLIDDRRQIGGCLRWTVEEVGEHVKKYKLESYKNA